MIPVACGACGAPVLWFRLYNGHTRPFDATEHTSSTHTMADRWYVRRNPRIAIPADVAGTTVRDGTPYLIEHQCHGTRRDIFAIQRDDDEPTTTALAVARREGPYARSLPLTDTHCTYTYRWPTSWAHIVHHGYTAICGAMMHGPIRTKPSEREHIKDMPVCPDCRTTYLRTFRNQR